MKLPPDFSQQEFDDDGTPLVGGKLYTFIAGTEDDATTYQDEAGDAENTNPIILDARGEYNMRLDPAVVYDLVLTRADDTAVWTKENVVASASANEGTNSVNGLTGEVVLTAEDIGFTTGTSTDWFVGTDVAAAVDAVITKIDEVSADVVTQAGNEAFNTYTGSSTVQLADRGACHYKTDGTTTHVPASVFASGDVVQIVNANAITTMNVLPGSGMTLYLGAGVSGGARTLAPATIGELRFFSPTVAFFTGAGVT